MAADVVRVRVRISGHVQGVGFRWGVGSRARSLGLGGSVRNLPDGTVEAFLEGPRDRVESVVDWCRHGPSGAKVDAIEVAEEPPIDEIKFAQRPVG
ncbi:MAG TPA: acylphosphatase [Gaiellaceae bacterium]|nr:acylphosphatase [Gaiellaceae bacterium]